MTVCADNPYMRAVRVTGVDEHVPCGGHGYRWHTQKRSALRVQPQIAVAPGRRLVIMPVTAECAGVDSFHRNCIGRVDLKILEGVRKIADFYLDVD